MLSSAIVPAPALSIAPAVRPTLPVMVELMIVVVLVPTFRRIAPPLPAAVLLARVLLVIEVVPAGVPHR